MMSDDRNSVLSSPQLNSSAVRLFVSDLHIESPDEPRFLRFAELLNAWKNVADGIWLLGDITELWIGDDDDAPIASAFRQLLSDVSAACPVYLMHGNRDFLYGERLEHESGVTLIADPTVLPDGVLLSHGDAWCIDDVPYQQFRAMARSSAWQADILAKSLGERRFIGQAMRAQSRESNANKAANIMDVNAHALSVSLAGNGCHSVIHGHTHRPGVQMLDTTGTRMVLGAWDGGVGWYGLQEAGELKLRVFSLAHRYEIEAQDRIG